MLDKLFSNFKKKLNDARLVVCQGGPFEDAAMHMQVPIKLSPSATFEEYLQMVVPEDPCIETQIDPLSMGAKPGKDRAAMATSSAPVSPDGQVLS